MTSDILVHEELSWLTRARLHETRRGGFKESLLETEHSVHYYSLMKHWFFSVNCFCIIYSRHSLNWIIQQRKYNIFNSDCPQNKQHVKIQVHEEVRRLISEQSLNKEILDWCKKTIVVMVTDATCQKSHVLLRSLRPARLLLKTFFPVSNMLSNTHNLSLSRPSRLRTMTDAQRLLWRLSETHPTFNRLRCTLRLLRGEHKIGSCVPGLRRVKSDVFVFLLIMYQYL